MLPQCSTCIVTGDRGLNLVVKSDVSEHVAEALPDLIQSVPDRHVDSTENKVVHLIFWYRHFYHLRSGMVIILQACICLCISVCVYIIR